MSNRNFGLTGGPALGGTEQPTHLPRYSIRERDLGSLPRSPSELLLHPEHISNPNFEIPALCFVALTFFGIIVLLIAAYYAVDMVFGV